MFTSKRATSPYTVSSFGTAFEWRFLICNGSRHGRLLQECLDDHLLEAPIAELDAGTADCTSSSHSYSNASVVERLLGRSLSGCASIGPGPQKWGAGILAGWTPRNCWRLLSGAWQSSTRDRDRLTEASRRA